MRNINRGKIINDSYVKKVNWNSAVLWMTKEISLPVEEMVKIFRGNVKKIVFEDRKKACKYVFKTEDVDRCKKLKRVGQEPQFYWSITLANKVPLNVE